MLENAILFSLSANPSLASSIAKKLHVKLGERTIKKFPSGETIVEPVDTVRGKLTVKVQMFLGREMPVEVDLDQVEKED